jgi:hypothetical protein
VTPPPPARHPGRAATIAGGVLLGAALVSGGVLIYTYKSYNDLQPQVSAELKALGSNAADSDKGFFSSPTCNPPATVTGNVAKYRADCQQGQNFANATTGLWVATGVLAAGGLTGIIVGQVQAAHARKERATTTGALMRQTLRIAPLFSTAGGGVTAAFEF